MNDHIREVLEGFRSLDGEFLCECDLIACTERITITLADYDAMRGGADGGRLFAVKHRPTPV